MKIELWPISKPVPYPGNPRLNDGAVEAVARSLKEYGFRQPIVVDVDGVVVCGHTRLKAAVKLGLESVPVHVATDLTPEQIRAYRIADNQTATIAEWNMDLPPLELCGLREANYDLSLLGFDAEELARILGGEVSDGECDPDDVPLPPDDPVTQPGDLWILGNHRLLCGDSSKPEDLDRLLGGQPVHLCNTDPPYNVKVEPRSKNAIAAGLSSFTGDAASTKLRNDQGMAAFTHAINQKSKAKKAATGTAVADAPKRKMRAKDRPLANDFVSDEAFDALLDAWFSNIARVLLPGRSFYIWGGYANCGNYPPVLKRHGLYFSQSIIWDKQHPVLTRKDFMGAHEWCQPPDTMVCTPHGNVPISSLADGDTVISFSLDSLSFSANPIRVTSRIYEGLLYCVSAGDRMTWCTPEHLWSVRDRNDVVANAVATVSTSNLISGEMVVPVARSSDSVEWLEVNVIEQQYYSGPVYSMEVACDHHYVADGIVTHNCFYGWKEGAGHKFYGPNNATDLWQVKKIPPQQLEHLTGKPAELAVRAMQYSSVAGENVLDLFGGSGSTLIGAEQCGRNAFLMEIDPPYADVIVDRFQRFSGKPAVLERTGESPIPMKPREENMR